MRKLANWQVYWPLRLVSLLAVTVGIAHAPGSHVHVSSSSHSTMSSQTHSAIIHANARSCLFSNAVFSIRFLHEHVFSTRLLLPTKSLRYAAFRVAVCVRIPVLSARTNFNARSVPHALSDPQRLAKGLVHLT